MWSPVFEKMFTSDFAEKDAEEIALPGKKAKEVEVLLKIVYSHGRAQRVTGTSHTHSSPPPPPPPTQFLECRKVIGFALSTLRDWLKKLAPIFYPIRSKTKTNRDSLARVFPRFASITSSRITSSFDWFPVLCVFFVIGSSNYFGFGFTTLN